MTGYSSKPNEDNELVKRALKGDGRAFELIVRKYQKQLYFTIRKIVSSHEDTDDILQETFIKAYHRLDTYKAEYPFYPWLHRIAVNTAINHYKKYGTREESSLNGMIDAGNPFPSNQRNPHHQVEQAELNELVKSALEKLPFEQKMVFILRTSEELTYEEISDRLNISIGTVMSRLSRAREKLRKLLRGYFVNVS